MERSSSTANPQEISSSDESDNLTAVATGRDERGFSEHEAIRADTLSRRPTNPNDVELERINTYCLQQRSTVGSGPGPAPRSEWLPMGAGKPYPPALPDPEQFVADFTDATTRCIRRIGRCGKRSVSRSCSHIRRLSPRLRARSTRPRSWRSVRSFMSAARWLFSV